MNAENTVTLLRDPAWQFVGVVLAIAALLLSCAIYMAQRQRRRITYQRIASIPLLTVKEELAGTLSVTFDGLPVKMLRTTTVRIQNAGNLPITESDYVEPIVIHVEVGAKILSADIVESSPFSLRPVLTVTDRGAALEPLLLNPKDSFVVKLLVQDGSEFAFPSGRIVGVTKFERVSDPDRRLEYFTFAGMLLFLIGQGAALLFSPKRPPIERSDLEYVGLTVAAVGAALWMGTVVFAAWRKHRIAKKDARNQEPSTAQ